MKLVSNKSTWLVESGTEKIFIPKDHPNVYKILGKYLKEYGDEISKRLKKIKMGGKRQ